MSDNVNLLEIVQTALGTFDHRQSFTPGMFEPLEPLFRSLGYDSVAVYIADDYPDRMQRISGYGCAEVLPEFVVKHRHETLFEELTERLSGIKGLLSERLFNHDRELGALVAVAREPGTKKTREAFRVLTKAVSIMAYVERIRTNGRREREERDIFFAQALTNRMLAHKTPRVRGLRLGVEFIRSLEGGGDFYDFLPDADGGMIGVIGCCSGKGLRTVLEVADILNTIHHACQCCGDRLSPILEAVNTFLVEEKRRAHQASLCVFRVDTAKRTLTLAKAGRLGMLLCGPGRNIDNISAPGGAFLGMMPDPAIKDETYDFRPGQSLFCVTEGFYTSRNCLNVKPQLHWFLQTVETTLELKGKTPLANAIFENLDKAPDCVAKASDSMLALSVEFTGKKGDTMVRI